MQNYLQLADMRHGMTSPAAKKGLKLGQVSEKSSAGAKAQRLFQSFVARLKSCP
jgi:hypothetical protein